MNYIQLINAFWAKAESDNLKGNDISVYFSLVKYCNKLNWLNPFVCHWDIVCQYAKVSKNSYYKSVETLHDKGYIKYEKGKKNQLKPKIVILKLENKEGTIKEQNGEQHEEQNREQKGNLYKLLNNKTIKLLNKNASLVNSNLEKWINSEYEEKPKKPIFNFRKSLIDLGVEEQVAEDWMKVRKNKNAVNTETSFKRIKNHIIKSGKDPNECITLAVAKDWKGFEASWIINETKKQNEQLSKNEQRLNALKEDW